VLAALRERASQSQLGSKDLPEADLDPYLLAALLGLAQAGQGESG
jgi:hypothetical protein